MRSYFCDCFEDWKYGHRGSFNVCIKQNQKGNQWEERRFFPSFPHVSLPFCTVNCIGWHLNVQCQRQSACLQPMLKDSWQGAEIKILPRAFNAELAYRTYHLSSFSYYSIYLLDKSRQRSEFSSNRATAIFHLWDQ